MLFLHTMFGNIDFLKGEVAKYFEIPESSISLIQEKDSTEENKTCILSIYDEKFYLNFVKRIDEPKEIDVPKVIKKPKKWYQTEAETAVVVEKKKTKPYTYWVLNEIK